MAHFIERHHNAVPVSPVLPQIQDTRSCVACVGQQNASEVIRRMDFAITSM